MLAALPSRFRPIHGALLAVLPPIAMMSCYPEFRDCAPVNPTQLAALPPNLSGTKLFVDLRTEALAEGVRPFTPRFTMWTDGATKRRWIYLPPSAQIDTSDPDAWNFPVGTKLWKEFTRDGVRVETRMLFKHGAEPGAWTPISYVWSDDGDGWATPDGVVNARGTTHDVPSAGSCHGCHGGTVSGVLGFSAIQLPRHGNTDEIGLDELVAAGRFSGPLPRSNELPGDAATQAALGYLHANCSHCHNQTRPQRSGPRCFDPERSFSFMLRTAELDQTAATATYRTAVGEVISAGNPDGSEILSRVQSRDPRFGMPALGTKLVDDEGVDILTTWVKEIH
jgi:hypothetical protein